MKLVWHINMIVSVSTDTEITKHALTSFLKNIDFLFLSLNVTFTTDCKITFWFLVFSFSMKSAFLLIDVFLCVCMYENVRVWEREIRTEERVTVAFIQDFLIFWLSSHWKKPGRPCLGKEGHMNEWSNYKVQLLWDISQNKCCSP